MDLAGHLSVHGSGHFLRIIRSLRLLNLNVHFHTLALDGIYIEDEMGCIRFQQAAPPSDAEVARVTERIQRQITKLLERRGLGPQADGDESDALRNSQPLLAELYGASICGRVATGPRAGRRIAKVGDAVDLEDIAVPAGPRCATIAGYSVHANICIPAHDRMRLERLCRLCGDLHNRAYADPGIMRTS